MLSRGPILSSVPREKELTTKTGISYIFLHGKSERLSYARPTIH